MSKPTRFDSATNVWITPRPVLAGARRVLGDPIPLDPCTEADNPTGAARFFLERDNGLKKKWTDPCWCNPPYSGIGVFQDWALKVRKEALRGCPILFLMSVTNRVETDYFRCSLMNERLSAVVFFWGRLAFRQADLDGEYQPRKGNNYASMMLGFNVDASAVHRGFGDLGSVLSAHVQTGAVCG
jgi:hypothetical protein